jgi:3-hydroxybutyryl-CoA dehydrogenase
MKDKAIGVVGAGLMGVGIATRFAQHGYATAIYDVSPERVAAVLGIASAILDELQAAGQISADALASTLRLLQPTDDLADLRHARLVIEAVPENLEIKHATYRELEALLADDAIIGSNTSGYLPDLLSRDLKHPQRFLVTHFWNAPHTIPLVEIVPGRATDPQLPQAVASLLAAIGAKPVVLTKAIPGFIGNRLQYAVLREAMAIVQSGAASVEVVDEVMKASLGRRYGLMGPFEIADLGGLDTFLAISEHLMPELSDDQDCLEVLRAQVQQGRTGIRTGEGFYQWDDARRAHLKEIRRQQLRGVTIADPQ